MMSCRGNRLWDVMLYYITRTRQLIVESIIGLSLMYNSINAFHNQMTRRYICSTVSIHKYTYYCVVPCDDTWCFNLLYIDGSTIENKSLTQSRILFLVKSNKGFLWAINSCCLLSIQYSISLVGKSTASPSSYPFLRWNFSFIKLELSWKSFGVIWLACIKWLITMFFGLLA